MSRKTIRVMLYITSLLFSLSLTAKEDVDKKDNAPSFVAKIKLSFNNKTTCNLSDFGSDKSQVQGRSNITHDEGSISWTSTCIIRLPTTTRYCVISSQEVTNPDTFYSRYSGFQSKVIRAKIVSESDINPDFGSYAVTYLCFE